MEPRTTPSSEAFTLTQRALDFMRRMVRTSGLGDQAGFRLAVEGGAGVELTDNFSIETEPAEGDTVLNFGRVVLYVPRASRSLLAGVTVDFPDSPQQAGLAFSLPRAPARRSA